MKIENFYPAKIDASSKTFNSIMRSLLIRASYDGILKKVTGYKGMFLSEEAQECWSLKFEGLKGIFGLILTNSKQEKDGFLGSFNLYYYPSKDDEYLEKCSLFEEYIALKENFIDKVRSFSLHKELLDNFCIGSINLFISSKDALFISYTTQTKIKSYSKDGVIDKLNLIDEKFIIKPNGIDKNFPSFRVMLKFFTFFNTLLTRIGETKPNYFEIEKREAELISYDKKGDFFTQVDKINSKLTLFVGYGSMDFKKFNDINNNLKYRHVLYKFFEGSSWKSEKIDFTKYKNSSTESGFKPKMILVTGFLGSGKTQFLQNYIECETAKSRFVGIIQNEIGKVGLDGKLLDYDYSLVEIDEGCICCSLAGQLKTGVATLMEQSNPDTILVETTGVANPFNMLSELNELESVIDIDSIVCVVDGLNAKELWENYTIFRDQVRAADVILLNKVDLMSKSEIERVEEFLSSNNKCANIIKTVNCDVNPEIVSTSSELIKSSTSHISSMFTEETPLQRTHTQDKIVSKKMEIIEPLDMSYFKSALKTTPKNILRIKGIVEFESHKNQFVVQFVNGKFELIEMEDGRRRDTFLVFIGRDIDKYNLESICYR